MKGRLQPLQYDVIQKGSHRQTVGYYKCEGHNASLTEQDTWFRQKQIGVRFR